MGHLTSKHGMTLVKDVEKLATSILHLVDALVKLGEETKVLEKFGKLVDFFADAAESKPGTVMGERHLEKKLWNWISGKSGGDEYDNPGAIDAKRAGLPNLPAGVHGGKTQTIEVNQTLQFQHDGKDAKKTGDSTHKAVKDAFRQMSAQSQGT